MISFIFFLTGRGGGQQSGLAVQFGEEGAALLDEDFGRFGEQDVGRQRSRRLDVNCVEKNQNDKKNSHVDFMIRISNSIQLKIHLDWNITNQD